jgi:ribose transport system permease protein
MMQRLLPFLTLTVLFVALVVASPNFLTATNLSSVARQTAVINIMSLGMTVIIIAGGIDLSVGAILAFAGVAGTMAMERGVPIPMGVLIGILTGLLWGLVNGVCTTRLRIPPFIVTLGTLGIIRGLTLIVTNGLPVHNVPRPFSFLGEGTILGIPFVLWILALCAVATHFLLEHTRMGRYAYAIGSNVEAPSMPASRWPSTPPPSTPSAA